MALLAIQHKIAMVPAHLFCKIDKRGERREEGRGMS
jgi:hypothetical protein